MEVGEWIGPKVVWRESLGNGGGSAKALRQEAAWHMAARVRPGERGWDQSVKEGRMSLPRPPEHCKYFKVGASKVWTKELPIQKLGCSNVATSPSTFPSWPGNWTIFALIFWPYLISDFIHSSVKWKWQFLFLNLWDVKVKVPEERMTFTTFAFLVSNFFQAPYLYV